MLNSKVVRCSDRNTFRDDTPWVIFLHGFGGSSNTWNKQTDEYSKSYNLLMIDFHGGQQEAGKLTVEMLCHQILEVMDMVGIDMADIVSISSGTLVALAFAANHPERVKSMVMGGGIIKFNLRTGFLLRMARLLKDRVTYMRLYRFFAHVIMPGRMHSRSRKIFVREAEKMGHEEFCRWIDLIPALKDNKTFITIINSLSGQMRILYVMGEFDHLFKKSILKAAPALKNSSVIILPECGHVCSIENPDLFNKASLEFFHNIRI